MCQEMNMNAEKSNVFKVVILISVMLINLSYFSILSADDKVWTGDGDATAWEDDTNWNPEGTPSASDDAVIQKKNAAVTVNQSLEGRSLSVGGKNEASISFDSFVSGDISPDNVTDHAIMNRRGGTIKLKGPGTIRVKGAYLDSEESLAPEPSFMLTVS